MVEIVIPVFGYKSHISIDKKHGVIRRQIVTAAAAHDGKRLREGLIDHGNTCGEVGADTAYRSAENKKWLKENGLNSGIHRKKPRGRPMPARTSKANGCKSKDRAKAYTENIGHKRSRNASVNNTCRMEHEYPHNLCNSLNKKDFFLTGDHAEDVHKGESEG